MLYSVPLQPADTPEINIYQSGYARFDSDWKYWTIGNAFSRLYYIKKGRGKFISNGETFPMNEGFCYLLPFGTPFSYECDADCEMEKLYFHFSLTTLEDDDLFSRVKGIFELAISEIGVEEIFDCYGKNRYWDMIQTRSIIHHTISAFFKKCGMKKTPAKTYSETVRKTINYIRENLSAQLQTKQIAQELFISESTIRKMFKSETGSTIGNYIDELIFLEAKRMLIKNELPIKDISTALGFCDQFYFSRRFKEKYNITPSQYRKDALY